MAVSNERKFSWLQTVINMVGTFLIVGVMYGTQTTKLTQVIAESAENKQKLAEFTAQAQADIAKIRETVLVMEGNRFTSKDAMQLSDSINRLNTETTRLATITARTEQSIAKLEDKVDRLQKP